MPEDPPEESDEPSLVWPLIFWSRGFLLFQISTAIVALSHRKAMKIGRNIEEKTIP